MLLITIVTLLITSNVISRIQAEEQDERKSQLNGMPSPVYKSNSLIEALKVQKRDTLNIVPESYVEQTNHVDESQRGNRLRRDLSNNFLNGLDKSFSVFNAPSNRTGQVNVYGSEDVQIGNTYSDNPNGTNVFGPTLIQENNTYQGKNENAQYGANVTQIGNRYPGHPGKNDIYTGVVVQKGNSYPVNPENKTRLAITVNQANNTYAKSIENNKDVLKPVIHQSGNFHSSSNGSEAGMNTKNNTKSQGGSVEHNTSDSQGNSSSTNYDSDLGSHIESTTLHNEEKEAYAEQHTKPNGQMSLSSNVFYSLSYSFILLVKYVLF